MKRLILVAVAASMLSAPIAQAAPVLSVGTPAVKSDVVQIGQRHGVKKVEVKRKPHVVKKKVVVRKKPHWKNGQRYSDWRRHQAVHDWRRHGLRDPGHGREWIRVGNDYLLVSIATGIIAGIIASQY